MPEQSSRKAPVRGSRSNASRTDLPWAAQMAVIRGTPQDKRERNKEDAIEEPSASFHRAASAPARQNKFKTMKKVSPWQQAEPASKLEDQVSPWQEAEPHKNPAFNRSCSALDEKVIADPVESYFRQDSRIFTIDSDGDCDEGLKTRLKNRTSEYSTCGLFSYSIDGKPSAASVPFWPVFPACVPGEPSDVQQAWPFQCAMQGGCWTEKPPFKEDIKIGLHSFSA